MTPTTNSTEQEEGWGKRPRNIHQRPEFKLALQQLLAERRTTLPYIQSPLRSKAMNEARRAVVGLCRAHGMGWRQAANLVNRDPASIRKMMGARTEVEA